MAGRMTVMTTPERSILLGILERLSDGEWHQSSGFAKTITDDPAKHALVKKVLNALSHPRLMEMWQDQTISLRYVEQAGEQRGAHYRITPLGVEALKALRAKAAEMEGEGA